MPPVANNSQIIYHLTTSGNSADGTSNGDTRTWQSPYDISYSINHNPFYSSDDERLGYVPMTDHMINMAAEGFELWDDLIALTLERDFFGYTSIHFNYSSITDDGGTYASVDINYDTNPDTLINQDIWFNSNDSDTNQDSDIVYGEDGFRIYLHEIGHSLGLSHPGNYNGSGSYSSNAEYAQDTRQFTVMSYFNAGSDGFVIDHWGSEGVRTYASTPMLHDVLAIQALYGADYSTRNGATIYGFNSTAGRDVFDFSINSNPIITIWDGGGNDTLDASGYWNDQVISLVDGTYSNIGYLTQNVAIAFNAIIEDAVGGHGNDTIYGNQVGNSLTGNDGNDTLYGDNGNDLLLGGNGDDILSGGGDNDILNGNAGNDVLNGNYGNDTLSGGGGNDILDGNSGNDSLFGDGGDDLLFFDASDAVVDGGSGFDVGYVTGTINLADVGLVNVEEVRGFGGVESLTGNQYIDASGLTQNISLYGNTLHDVLTGGSGDDELHGGLGNDLLSGGIGADRFFGGDGDDVFFIDSADTEVDGGSGTDTAYVDGSINLASVGLLGVEIVSGGFAFLGDIIDGSGLTQNIIIKGENGDDTLTGGSGADQLYGGYGSDHLYFDIHDTVVDGGVGFDIAYTSGSINLAAVGLASIEQIKGLNDDDMLNASLLSQNAHLDGQDGDDTIYGSAHNDTIIGGSGADRLYGGDGNDTIFFDAADTVINGGAGNDAGYTSGTVNLAAIGLIGIEEIHGSPEISGNDNFNGTGLSQNIRLYGHSGVDRLTGGLGADSLYGGADNDYIFFAANDSVVDGGAGWDTGYISGNVVFADMTFTDMEQIVGSGGVDRFDASGLSQNIHLIGQGGNDVLRGGSGVNYLGGGDGNDRLYGGSNADYLVGGAGNDYLFFGSEDAEIYGGSGWDIGYTSGTVDLGAMDFAGVEQVIGSSGADTFITSSLAQDIQLFGQEGDDGLFGNGYQNYLNGGAGADILNGGGGADFMIGGTGNDIFYFDALDRVVNGGIGFDVAHTVDSHVDLAAVGMSSVEQVKGNADANNINASGLSNNIILHGLGGDDVLIGGSGIDYIDGGLGVDRLFGGLGADRLYGGAENDYLFFDNADTAVSGGAGWDIGYTSGSVNLAGVGLSGIEQIIGSASNDMLNASLLEQNIHLYGQDGDDKLFGGGHQDYLNGGSGADILVGGGHADRLYGGAGNDLLYFDAEDISVNGGAGWDVGYTNGNVDLAFVSMSSVELVLGADGNDMLDASGLSSTIRLYGQGGNDTLIGGKGDDLFYGQGGSDTFVFEENWGQDVIGDFNANGEIIDFSGANISYADLAIQSSGVNTLVYVGAEGISENVITLQGIDSSTVDANDFLF